MRRYQYLAVLVLGLGLVLLGLWAGAKHQASAYDGGGTGTSTLSFDPQSLTVQQGGAASAKVTVKLASGKTWGTNVGAADVPTGVTISFDPASGHPTFTSTMTVKATSAANPGVYKVKVQATGDDPSATVQYQVTVSKGSYGY